LPSQSFEICVFVNIQVAEHYMRSDRLTEGLLNRVEAVIRAYDPCLSCSTHALVELPLQVSLDSPEGSLTSP
jgi:NAD-reducing hydrogenase large subunit